MNRLFFLLFAAIFVSDGKIRTLYNSLDTASVTEHLAFYQLYHESPWGEKALSHAMHLLTKENNFSSFSLDNLMTEGWIEGIVHLIQPLAMRDSSILTADQMAQIQYWARDLPHTKKRGHCVASEEEILSLPIEEIDLARALLIAFDEPQRLSYEAQLDWMALQILARTSLEAPPEEKIRMINRFVFEEMRFTFPPHSLYAKEIDTYTFLPSVIDSHQGVCLGVSILYVCLAQRLGLSLEMITPPGHIYVRYREGGTEINIETTARGIHLDSSHYLGIETRSLQQRDLREMIGLAFFNQAAQYWEHGEAAKALEAYQRAVPYLGDDPLLTEFMGYQYLFLGQNEKGRELLQRVADHHPEESVSRRTIAADYLSGHVDSEGIRTIFLPVDEKRTSVLEKKAKLEEVLQRFPLFREGIFHLAVTWLQLHRQKEALETLERYHALDPHQSRVEYFLSALYLERYDYPKAWDHYRQCKLLLAERDHNPKLFRELGREIRSVCPYLVVPEKVPAAKKNSFCRKCAFLFGQLPKLASSEIGFSFAKISIFSLTGAVSDGQNLQDISLNSQKTCDFCIGTPPGMCKFFPGRPYFFRTDYLVDHEKVLTAKKNSFCRKCAFLISDKMDQKTLL